MSLRLFIQKIKYFFKVVFLFFLIISGEHLAIEQLATTKTLLYFVVNKTQLSCYIINNIIGIGYQFLHILHNLSCIFLTIDINS